MLTHPLAERLRTLGMTAMADTFIEMQNNPAAEDLTREDWLGLLLDREVTARDNKRVGRRLSRHDYARTRLSRTRTSVPRVAWIAGYSRNSPAVTGSVIASIW